MNLLKKGLLTLTMVLGFAIGVIAQSGWLEEGYYVYKGGSDVVCGQTQVVYKSNGYTSWTEGWQRCKRRNWHQEYRSGYVYVWGPNGWYTEFREGYFWYFTWYTFDKRVW